MLSYKEKHERNRRIVEGTALRASIRVDSLSKDTENLSKKISAAASWQDADTMSRTQSELESMTGRLKRYGDYLTNYYTGTDRDELIRGVTGTLSYYKSAKSALDNRAGVYANYLNPDAYNTALEKYTVGQKYAGKSYGDIKSLLFGTTLTDTERKYLSKYGANYGWNTKEDYEEELADVANRIKEQTEKEENSNPYRKLFSGNPIIKVFHDDSDEISVLKDYKNSLETQYNLWKIDNPASEYRALMDKEDFAEKSQYIKPWTSGVTDRSLFSESDDLIYHYVNKDEAAQSFLNVTKGISKDDATARGLDQLSDEEVSIYNYIYSTQGKEKSDEYLDALRVSLNARQEKARAEKIADVINDSHALTALMNISTVPLNGIGSAMGFAGDVQNKLAGKEYNPYDSNHSVLNYVSAVRQATGEKIEDNTDFDVAGINVGRFLYDTAMSGADSLFGGKSFGSGYSAIMGMGAAEQQARELYESGAGEGQIIAGSLLAGAAEMAFEYISLDKLLKEKDIDSVKKLILEGLKQAGVEASEEMATEVANTLSDYFVRGNTSDIMQEYNSRIEAGMSEKQAKQGVAGIIARNIISSGIGGALSGGVLGAVTNVSGFYANTKQGKKVVANEQTQSLRDLADELGVAYDAKRLDKNSITAAGNLYSSVQNKVTENFEDAVKSSIGESVVQRLIELGETEEHAGEIAEAVTKKGTGEKLTVAEKKMLSTSRNANLAAIEIRNYLGSNDVQMENKRYSTEWLKQIANAENMKKVQAQQERLRDIATKSNHVTEESENKNAGTNIGGIAEDENEKRELRAKKGTVLSANEAVIAEEIKDMDERAADALVKNYDGTMDAKKYVDAFNLVVEYGRLAYGTENVLRNKGGLTEEQVVAAYRAGAQIRSAERAVQETTQKFFHENSDLITGRVGRFDDSAVDGLQLSSDQRSAIEFARMLSQYGGVNITIDASKADASGRRSAENGYYDTETNTIHVDAYAGMTEGVFDSAFIQTLSHEMTHWIRGNNAALYEALQESVLNVLPEYGKYDLQELIGAEKERYAQTHDGEEISDEIAAEELVARALEDMLSGAEKMKDFISEMAVKDESFIGGFTDMIHTVLDRLKEWISSLVKKFKSNSREAKVLRNYEDRFEAIRQQWDDAVVEIMKDNKNSSSKQVRDAISPARTSETELANDELTISVRENTEDVNKKFSERQKTNDTALESVETDDSAYRAYTDKGMSDFVDRYFNGELGKKSYYKISDKISERLANDIHAILGIDVSGYGNEITKNYLEHIVKRHGENGSADHSLKNLEDIKKLSFVIDNYDRITASGKTSLRNSDNSFAGGIILQKRLNDGFYYVVEAVPDNGKKRLEVVSAYINKKDIPAGEKYTSPSLTSQNVPASDIFTNSLNQNGEIVNTKSLDNLANDVNKKDIPARERYTSPSQTSENELASDIFTNTLNQNTEDVNKKYSERQQDDNTESLNSDIELLNEVKKISSANIEDVSLGASAGFILRRANSTYGKVALKGQLKALYDYMAGAEKLTQGELMQRVYGIAQDVVSQSREQKIENPYYRQVLSDIRKDKIRLNDAQKAEGINRAGSNKLFRESYFGKINVSESGTYLDQKWQEWSQAYPDIFDVDTNPNDMLTELLDIYDSVRLAAEYVNIQDYAAALDAVATEIYNQFWNVLSASDAAHEAQFEQIRQQHEDSMANMRRSYASLIDSSEEAKKANYDEMMKGALQKWRKERAEIREHGRKQLLNYMEQTQRKTKIEQIRKRALRLNKKIVENSAKEHIPETLKEPVAKLLASINFSSEQLLGLRGGENAGTPTNLDISLAEAFAEVQKMVSDAVKERNGDDTVTTNYFLDLPADFSSLLDGLAKVVNKSVLEAGDNEKILARMSLEELSELNTAITAISKAVSQANKLFENAMYERVNDAARSTMNELRNLGKRKDWLSGEADLNKVTGFVKDYMEWDEATPHYAFKRLGTAAQSLFKEMREGQARLAFHADEIKRFAWETYTEQEVKEWSKDVKKFNIRGKEIQMTVPQIMSLQCLFNREQARGHILGNGFRIEIFRVGKGEIAQTETIQVSGEDVMTILASLTDRQTEVAGKLQKYMQQCGEWGNEVSMKRFGYRQFTEEDYFPITVDENSKNAKAAESDSASLYQLLNQSFTKKLTVKANNAIIVKDIFDVFADHTTNMAKYHAYAIPVLDMLKWYNYKETTDLKHGFKEKTQKVTESLEGLLETAYGKAAKRYITQFIRDINRNEDGGHSSLDSFAKKLVSSYKVAAVAGNLRVALLQPTAYVRAGYMIDKKYLLRGLGKFGDFGKLYNEACEHSGIAKWKSMGFYDTNIGRSVQEQIKHNETIKDKVNDKALFLAEQADAKTWGCLWGACIEETKELHPELARNSEKFIQIVTERFEDIIYSTQVVDSILTRSQVMRSKSLFTQSATSFMSEPTIGVNIIMDSVRTFADDARRLGSKKVAFIKNKDAILKSFEAFAVTALCNALAESVIDWFRDKDDDKFSVKSWAEIFGEDFLGDINVLTMVPWIKDVWTLVYDGYDIDRMDMQGIGEAADFVKSVRKAFQTESGWNYQKTYKALTALSHVSGLPASNPVRDAVSIWNTIAGIAGWKKIE